MNKQQCDYLWGSVEGVRIQNWLNHDERLSKILSHKMVSVVGALIGTVVEYLKEWRPPQMEHELKKEKAE